MESLLITMVLLLGFAVMGGALAGGAWVVWRYLEQRTRRTQ
jgi:hypothetical protein